MMKTQSTLVAVVIGAAAFIYGGLETAAMPPQQQPEPRKSYAEIVVPQEATAFTRETGTIASPAPADQGAILWNKALKAYSAGSFDAEPLLEEYVSLYPASSLANRAQLLLADVAFFRHDWPEALARYNDADISGLAGYDRSLYAYRKALSLIKTGHFPQARTELRLLSGDKFTDIRNFYTAYLDYIEGDFSAAYKGFSKVKSGIPGLDAGYYLCQIEYSRGNYEKVIDTAGRMTLKNPVPELVPEMLRISGMSFFKLGKYTPARDDLREYLAQCKGTPDAEALYALGVIDYEDANYMEAEKRFAPVTERTGTLGQSAWLYLGQCRLHNGDTQGAVLAFEKASAYETDPDVAQTSLYNYLTALTRGGTVPFSKSTELMESYLQRWPDSPHAREVEEYIAASYYNDHNYVGAVEYIDGLRRPGAQLKKILQKALYQQGVILAANGKSSQSESWLRRAAAMQDQDRDLALESRLWLADALYKAGNFKAAADDYRIFTGKAAAGSNRTLAYYNLGYAEFQQGKYEAAAADFLKALDARPALAPRLADDARMRRADCLYYTGRYAEAASLFSNAARSSATNADYAAYRAALISGRTDGPRKKIQELTAFVKNYPDSKWVSQALLEKALTHEELGETSLAAEAYRKRLAITPDADIDELMRAARTGDTDGNAPADQLEILQRIRRGADLSAAETAEMSLYEANALARLNRDAEADAIYTSLARNPESLAGATAAVTLAERLNSHADYQKAFDMMEAFTDAGTPHQYWMARGFIALADAAAGLGNTRLAREYLEALSSNYPGNEADITSAINSRLKKLKR